MQLEVELNLGFGGFYDLGYEDRVAVLAYARVKADPTGENAPLKGLGALKRKLGVGGR